jgi:glycosyltransferase involved in cell wall biosynthesis
VDADSESRRRPSVSVVVPVYNGGEAFDVCLSSMMACAPPADEIIVVANGDTDGSRARAERRGVRVLRTLAAVRPIRKPL